MTVERSVGTSTTSAQATGHPLDPLSEDEVTAAADIVKATEYYTPSTRFVLLVLNEPTKPASLEFDPTDPPAREAFVITYDPVEKVVYELIVNLDTSTVTSRNPVPGRFPPLLRQQMIDIADTVRSDKRWQDAMIKRGVTDLELVMIDAWVAGYWGDGDHYDNSPQICRPLSYVRTGPNEHGYARPVENLIVLFNIDTMEVMDVLDYGIVPLPPKAGNFIEELMFDPDNRPAFTGYREDLKEISITQPDGPSWKVDGWGVTWQKWAFRVGFHPREGILLHQITYNDRGVERPIVYRAALSEMVVPYGDSGTIHWNKNVFDMGETGMGVTANSLTLGCDCLGVIHYFDGVIHDADGTPVTIPNAICMHEEDFGMSWKHTDARAGETEVRRARRLVISQVSTLGNYEYGFYWYLYTDGSIEYEVKLTGVLSTGSIAEGEVPRYGNLVAPGLYGPHHQHHFNVRMDMTIDGPNNTVYEVDSYVEKDELNPYKNAWYTEETPILSEAEGARDWKFETARHWKISSDKTNELGAKTSYKLVPREVVPLFVQEGSFIWNRANFLKHNLWVTKYDPDELYAAGDYVYQNNDVQGLPEYIKDDAPLENTDVVVWYTCGSHHIVRPEDWPVMPVVTTGFHLKPAGFFDGNPALDMPPEKGAEHCKPIIVQGKGSGHHDHDHHHGHHH